MEQNRKLAAIVFTDIVGYTRLMGQSEARAIEVLQLNRSIQKPLIEKYHGHFVKELGDGTIARFQKATDAVRCTKEILNAAKDHKDLNLRVGIHLGEVIIENEDVFGDGVNIASRIESASKAGAIYISGTVYGMVHNKDDIETRFVERMELKNVNRPIDIYEVAVEGAFTDEDTKPKEEKKPIPFFRPVMAGLAIVALISLAIWWALGSEPSDEKREFASIAVLPFTNMSTSEENEFFCDGVTEDILTHLSKLKNLKVISRTSVMHFKGSELTLPEIAEKLDVEYIVEGSVRRQGDQVAITAQLIHADSDGHLWANNYQKKLDDVFAIQSEVAQEITKALNLKISLEERSGLQTVPTESVEAYTEYMEGRKDVDDRSEEGIIRAQKHFERAIEIDPLYVEAYGDLSNTYQHLHYYHGYDLDSCHALSRGILQRAAEIDSLNYRYQSAKALMATYDRKLGYEKAEYHYKKALEDNPNDATIYHQYGVLCAFEDRSEEALEKIQRALELDPYSVVINRNIVYRLSDLGRHREAIEFAEENANIFTDHREYYNTLADIYAEVGNWKKALTFVSRMDSVFPEWVGSKFRSERIKFLLGHNKEDILGGLKNVFSSNPRNSRALYWYARRLMDFGEFERAEEFMNSENYLKNLPENIRKRNKTLLYYFSRDFKKAEEIYANEWPEHSNRLYCWVHLGKSSEVRDSLIISDRLSDYSKSFLYAGLNEIDSALHYFEKVEAWHEVASARFDIDMKPLWKEPRFKAKVDSYGFPEIIE